MSRGALFARDALLPEGWRENVLIEWTADGRLTSVATVDSAPAGASRAGGPVIPGMPNLHCHAFQRAMAGLAESRVNSDDSFWSWRDLMYRFAAKLTPDLLYAIARHLYIEMLKAGYASVCEFHYLHHDRNGNPYENPAENAACMIRAAHDSGIGLTFLPVVYQYGGFGEQPLRLEQKRFAASPEWVLNLVQNLTREHAQHDGLRYGVAPHSLRAASPESLRTLVDGARSIDGSMPVHIHVAEQTAEVESCRAHLHARPVEWLLKNFDVDEHWCLIHATHMTSSETTSLAASGAVAGLCPTTEANLGDGIFDAARYFEARGRWGIGSDSNISVSVAEELRMLEYGQRLRHQRRDVLANAAHAEVGEALYTGAVRGGAAASGRPIAGLSAGQRADFLVLDETHPALVMKKPGLLLSGLVFCSPGGSAIRDVFAGGQQVIAEGHHSAGEPALANYRNALKELLDA